MCIHVCVYVHSHTYETTVSIVYMHPLAGVIRGALQTSLPIHAIKRLNTSLTKMIDDPTIFDQ